MVTQDTMTTETVPRLYKEARPGTDFQNSLKLLQRFRALHPNIPTKSGLMAWLGETDREILQVLRYVHPDMFKMYAEETYKMGFWHAASGPLVRSSYHADQQAHAAGVS